MEIRKASPADLPMVGFITRRTIQEVYPHYYPRGAVEFFLDWHKDKSILPDIEREEVYLLFDGGMAAGTVTLHGEEITQNMLLGIILIVVGSLCAIIPGILESRQEKS